jgi:transposase
MAHLHRKIKKGRPYYYVREIQRVNGKPKVVSQVYLGSIEAILARAQESKASECVSRLKVEEFGSLFLAHELEKEIDTIGLIDSIIPRNPRETGPTVGEFFFYAWANRLIDPRSKLGLQEWYESSAIQSVRPLDLAELTSQRYWAKWERVEQEHVEKIACEFFKRVWSKQPAPPESVLFDTTNYFTYMASSNQSSLAKRGHSKDGKHELRQVGVGLLVDRARKLPLFYREYEGNVHDSKFFSGVIDEAFATIASFNPTKERLTVVFDKGMNSDENIARFDDHPRLHFVTTYSPFYLEELANTDIDEFQPVETRTHIDARGTSDQMSAFRTKVTLWGKERTVIVTHNPMLARKKAFTMESKLATLRETLLEFCKHYRESKPQWRNPKVIEKRYERLCSKLHIESECYRLEFGDRRRAPEMSFRKDEAAVRRCQAVFGRNIIVTDNHDWTTTDIVQLSLDRGFIETQFRTSKNPHHISMRPFHHWTDSKIRCQILTCVMALTMRRLIEIRVAENLGRVTQSLSGDDILDSMRHLHSVLLWYPGRRAAERHLETPTETQREVLHAFGWEVVEGGVLQSVG